MPNVRVKENESPESALRRFKRICEKAGILTEVRRREAYEKPTTRRKREAAAARKRHLKSLLRSMPKRANERRASERRANERRDSRPSARD